MKKKVLSAILVLAVMLSVVSITVTASTQTEITEVSISGLDFPVVGEALDTNYTIPASGIHYLKDINKPEVTWYVLDANDQYVQLDADAKVEYGKVYKVTMYLNRVNSDYIFDQQKNNVAVNVAENIAGKIVTKKSVAEKADTLRVELTFMGNMVYEAGKNWVYLNVNRYVPYWPVAGETPWADDVIANANTKENPNQKDFTIATEWFKKEDKNKALADDYQFEAGKEYVLRVTLNAARSAVFGTEALEPPVFIANDNLIGETVSASAEKMVVEFPFAVYGGVFSASIEGIKPPVAGESVQKNGFTLSATGATVEFAGWEYNNGSDELFHEFNGDTFDNDVLYRLKLKLAPKNGFVLNTQKDDIDLNCGSIASFSRNEEEGYIIIGIDFKTDKEVVDTIAAYITIPQDAQFPGYNATVPVNAGYIVGSKTENYTVNGVYWHNVSNEEPMQPNVTYFEKGKEYTVTIQIVPTDVTFPEKAEDIIATVNGQRAECIYDENGILNISYTYVAIDEITNDLGDVNNDSKINAKDALICLKISVNKYTPNENEKFAADVNKDNAINAKDALEILKHSVGKPSCIG